MAQCISDNDSYLASEARLHGYFDAIVERNDARVDQIERLLSACGSSPAGGCMDASLVA